MISRCHRRDIFKKGSRNPNKQGYDKLLHKNDETYNLHFLNFFKFLCGNKDLFSDHIVFSEGATYLNGALYRHTCRYWSVGTHNPQNIDIFASTLNSICIETYYFMTYPTVEKYLQVLLPIIHSELIRRPGLFE